MIKTPKGTYISPNPAFTKVIAGIIMLILLGALAYVAYTNHYTEPIGYVVIGGLALFQTAIIIKFLRAKPLLEIGKEGVIINQNYTVPWNEIASIEVVKVLAPRALYDFSYAIAFFGKDEEKVKNSLSKRQIAESFARIRDEDRVPVYSFKAARGKKDAESKLVEVIEKAKELGWTSE